MQMLGPPPPHRSLWRALLAGGAVIGFAMLGAFIIYLVTLPLLPQPVFRPGRDGLRIVLSSIEIRGSRQ